jgi:hypothetical protein
VHLDEDIPVTGYVLEVDFDGFGGFETIWDGRGKPEYNEFLLKPVQTGRSYNFRYKVINKNGESPYSELLEVWACELPSAPTTPAWVTSTENWI